MTASERRKLASVGTGSTLSTVGGWSRSAEAEKLATQKTAGGQDTESSSQAWRRVWQERVDGGAGLGAAQHAAKQARDAAAALLLTETDTTRWICESYGFIYDPDEGDPDGGIPPGTAFAEIPDSWFCPVCGAREKDFAPYEN